MESWLTKLKPQTIDDVVGNDNVKRILKAMLLKEFIPSFLIFGPPGTGKSTIARLFCEASKKKFDFFHAAIETKSDLERKIKTNELLIIDEIHRLNKDKQDILLPKIELNQIIVIALTTENPFYFMKSALRSRMMIFQFFKLKENEIANFLKLKSAQEVIDIKLDIKIINQIINVFNSDFRKIILTLELITKIFPNNTFTESDLGTIINQVDFSTSYHNDLHYDILSAFHKSLRGSDVDAALYYLAVLLKINDLIGIERRLLCVCYEDVGLANPYLGINLQAALKAAKKLGMPEMRIPLGQIVIEICQAPKSNSSYLAIEKAMREINQNGLAQIPEHLKQNSKKNTYLYPHDYGGYVSQIYLNKKIKTLPFYKPLDNHYEQLLFQKSKKFKKKEA